ncbi:NB-ARC [Dillenia turbinata]|uniref:NB-ARC n=1 Tax=Dillenia turbinata TaxID=194707 RepID=A0AAN8ZQJ9_9MAGN
MADSMVQAVVSSVIERITDQLINEFKFFRAVPDQVQRLQVKLKLIQSFLRDADAIMQPEGGQQLRTVVSQFRDIVYDLEDVIDTYILKVASTSRGGFIGFIKKPASISKKCYYIHQFGNNIEAINERISLIRETLPPHTVQDMAGASTRSKQPQQGWRRSYAHEEEEHVVGLDDDIDKLVRELNNEEADARVVSIVGIGGSGKTTLAKRLYNHADPHCVVHEPRSLTDDEAWELLSKITKIKEESTSEEVTELCKLGKELLKRCGGLPLLVVVLGGLLAQKSSLQEWKKLHQNVGQQLREAGKEGDQKQGKVMSILELSYDDLPYHLKPCFLYLGLFPEDADIQAKQMIRMWIAEGFILSSEIDREHTVESAGEEWLEELIQRSMIQHLTSHEKLRVWGIETAEQVDAVFKSPCISSDRLRSLRLDLKPGNDEFPSLEPLSHCERLSKLYIEGKIRETRQAEALAAGESSQQPQNGQFLLPLQLQLPPNLTKLTLYGSRLEKQDPLAVLEKLPYLKFLCIGDKSFQGTKMTCSTNGFSQLQHLEFRFLDNLEEWIVEKGAMPRLKHLELFQCTNLRMIPEGLRFISSLKELVIQDGRKEFQERLQKVKTRGDETSTSTTTTSQEAGEDFYKIQHIPQVKLYQL